MQKQIGIWLDHVKAVIVSLEGEDEHVTRVESDVESHHRATGGSPAPTKYGPQDAGGEKELEKRREHELRDYYQHILKAVDGADAIMVMGPGTARTEFKKEIQKVKHLQDKLRDVEAADKMTDKQWVAEVRKYYGKQPPRITDQTRL